MTIPMIRQPFAARPSISSLNLNITQLNLQQTAEARGSIKSQHSQHSQHSQRSLYDDYRRLSHTSNHSVHNVPSLDMSRSGRGGHSDVHTHLHGTSQVMGSQGRGSKESSNTGSNAAGSNAGSNVGSRAGSNVGGDAIIHELIDSGHGSGWDESGRGPSTGSGGGYQVIKHHTSTAKILLFTTSSHYLVHTL